MAGNGKLFVISAPSGTGKTTLVKKILKKFKHLSYSVSYTTRSPRINEEEGLDYFFISSAKFQEKIQQEHWLEWAKVHDNFYGTSKKFVKDNLEKNHSLILDIDVQGAKQVMESNLDPVTIFISPPSFEELSQRLENRGTDTKEVIARRLDNAKNEMKNKGLYQYSIINDDLDDAAKELSLIFKKEMAKENNER